MPGIELFDEDGEFIGFMTGEETSSGKLAGNVVGEVRDAQSGILRYQVTPTIAGVATPEQILSCASGEGLISAIAVFNALDLVTAGDAVANRFPDVKRIDPGGSIVVELTEIITKVWCVGLSTAANVGGFVVHAASTGAEIRAELLEFDFEAVDQVKTVEISLGSMNTDTTVINTIHEVGTIRVEGYSHA